MGILLPLSLYAIIGLVIMSLFFGFLNQSSLTPEEEQLTFFNYLFPLIATLGFTIYFPFQLTKKTPLLTVPKIFRIKLLIAGLLAFVAIPWQVDHILWQLDRQELKIFETAPYMIGLFFTIGVLIEEMKKIKTLHNKK
jgi:hypothetical protein